MLFVFNLLFSNTLEKQDLLDIYGCYLQDFALLYLKIDFDSSLNTFSFFCACLKNGFMYKISHRQKNRLGTVRKMLSATAICAAHFLIFERSHIRVINS